MGSDSNFHRPMVVAVQQDSVGVGLYEENQRRPTISVSTLLVHLRDIRCFLSKHSCKVALQAHESLPHWGKADSAKMH